MLKKMVIAIMAITSPLIASRTIFIPRPITFDSTYELALSNYDIYHHRQCLDDRAFVNFYATPFFQKNRKSNKLARYFLPNNSNCLNIQENVSNGNIGSLNLELISAAGTNFSSLVSIRPERRVFGSHFNIHFNLSPLLCGLWAGIAFAAIKAEHDLHLRETNIQGLGTLPGIQTATQALNNPAWCAGKLSPCRLSRKGIDDVQFKLGYDFYWCDDQNHIGLYALASAPTGKRPKSLYLFEPLVGSKHTSVGGGLNADFTIFNHCDSSNLNFMFDAKYRYVLKGRERRSFDLCPNGDWSRYLQVVTQANPLFSTPGINSLTFPVNVTPRSTFEFWSALHYQLCSFNVEVGYNLWWRDCEKVCLKCPVTCNLGVLDIPGICSVVPATSSTFRINQSIVGNTGVSDAVFTPITRNNINLISGSHPRTFTNKVYGAFAYNKDFCCTALLLGLGASYEFAHRCSALENWAVWGKFGLSF